MTSEPAAHRLLPLRLRDRGRVRRRGARGHRRAGAGHDGHRPDPPHPALRRPGREPHAGAGGAAPRARRGPRRRRPGCRHGAARHRRSRSRCPPARSLYVRRARQRAARGGGRGGGRGTGGARGGAGAPGRAARPGLHLRRARPLRPAPRPPCAPAPRSRTWATPVDPASLVRLIGGVVEQGRLRDGRALPAHRGHLGRPLRQPAAGGDGGRRPRGRVPGDRLRRAGGPPGVRAAQDPDGLPHRSSPTACSCAASTPSASWSRGSSACWSTPTGTWPWWPARPRRPHWLNVAAGELLVLAW